MADNATSGQAADFDQMYEENESKNRGYVAEFEEWLKGNGLAGKTVDKHSRNIESFLNWYLVREELIPMEEGMDCVEHFISTYLASEEFKSLATIKENLTSIKKFYQCMAERGHVAQGRYAELLEEIKYNKKYWFEQSQDYLDELPPRMTAQGLSNIMNTPLFSEDGPSFIDLLKEVMGLPADDGVSGGFNPFDIVDDLPDDEEAEADEETLQRLRDEIIDQLVVAALYVMSFKDKGKSGETVRLARKEVISEAFATCRDVEGYLGNDSPGDDWVHITEQGMSAAKSLLADLGYPELAKDEK